MCLCMSAQDSSKHTVHTLTHPSTPALSHYTHTNTHPSLTSTERPPQPADEGGQLQLQLLDPDKSEQQPLGLESGFQEYLR